MLGQTRRWLALVLLGACAVLGRATLTTVAAGDLDPSFGSGGSVTTSFGNLDSGQAVALQPDGKLVVAGSADGNFAVARYCPNGQLDDGASCGTGGFGNGGKVVTDLGRDDKGQALALQPDGKIVVAGSSSDLVDFAVVDFAVLRYCPNGQLDDGASCGAGGFGSGGKVLTDFGSTDRAHGVALQADGRIVVVGETRVGGSTDLALARYDGAGALDPSFDGDGKVVTNVAGNDLGSAVAVMGATQRLVVAGAAGSDFALLRYCPNGQLDDGANCGEAGFGTGGKVLTDFGATDAAAGVVIQSDEHIVVAGTTATGGSTPSSDFAVARYDSDGALDPSFDGDGRVTTTFNLKSFGNGVALEPESGRIVVAGRTAALTGPSDFAVARYLADGGLDTSLGGTGKLITNLGGDDYGFSVTVLADAKIVVAGSKSGGGDSDFLVARYLAATGPGDTATATGTSTDTPTVTATRTEVATGTDTATPTVTATGTGAATDTRTPSPTATTPSPRTYTPTATATGPVVATPTGSSPPCAPMSDVGLVAPAANPETARLLRETLAKHAAEWRAATGHSMVYEIYEYDGRLSYQQWLGRRLANGFSSPGFCAASYVALVGDNDLSRYYRHFVNLKDEGGPAAQLRTDFLDYAARQVLMPNTLGDPYALPWMRNACSESYQNLAIVAEPGDRGIAYDLVAFLVGLGRQRVNYDALASNGARLAFPTLRQPYETGWADGSKVTCVTRPPLRVPDPRLVSEAIDIARLNARDLEPILRTKFHIERYSSGPDTDNALYDSEGEPGSVIQQLGASGWVATSAVAMIVKEPVTSARMAELLNSPEGVIVGEIAFYAPNGQALTPTPVPTARPWPFAMYLPALSQAAGNAKWPYRGYAVLWRNVAGVPRAWLVRPDGSLATAADVAMDLGLPAGSVVFEEVLPSAEPILGAVVWAEQGSKKSCWGIDGFKWCQKK